MRRDENAFNSRSFCPDVRRFAFFDEDDDADDD
jgi:hypothetical protein